MPDEDYVTIRPVELKEYMDSHKEKEYLVLDVRSPDEYADGHIPGAKLYPLSDFESELFSLPDDRDLVIYCRNGPRSRAAASLAFEAEITEHRIMHLHGGMMLWNGTTLKGFPLVKVFDEKKAPADMLLTAMDLEKGAFRFYSYIAENHKGVIEEETLFRLIAAERSHAGIIFDFRKKMVESSESFGDLYDRLSGEILEGGEKLADMTARIEGTGGDPSLTLLELCIDIELSAYELYRTMADNTEDEELRDAFLTIAQSEKKHMRMLIAALKESGKTA